MNNYFMTVTPKQLLGRHPPKPGVDYATELAELEAIAEAPDAICDVCGTEYIWKYGQCGMCFTCTTGEADASEDYELTPERPGVKEFPFSGVRK